MTATGCSRKLIGKKLEMTVVVTSYSPAQFPAPPLPDQALEGMLGIGA